uniref:Carboxylic ester hydrolase n=1 Tax=Arcella intermedia TaxID=1963864 RepID=A0A6B2L2M5_9EUKA
MVWVSWLWFLVYVSRSSPIVNTPLGTLQGFYSSEFDEDVFLGVPYVEKPERFSPAMPKLPWSGVLQAQSVPPVCYQSSSEGFAMSEDCLYLNIYVPRTPATTPLPVMIWIHGGAFTTGSGSYYNGTHLAQRGVIVVTINYRLGPFGFLQSTEIQKENPSFPSLGGMNGIMDQIRAIEFISHNIASFGGNPKSITLFGESAGGVSICYLLVMARANNLFQRVIIESGSCLGAWGPLSVDLALQRTSLLLSALNVSNLAELRNVAASVIDSADVGFSPALDSYLLPDYPGAYYKNNALTIPPGGSILIGTNTLDTLFAPPWYNGPWPTNATYLPLLTQYFPTDANDIYSYYPPSPSSEIAFERLNGHVCHVCAAKELAEFVDSKFNTFVYEYRWNPLNPGYPTHGAELSQVFGTTILFPFNPTLSKVMMDYWSSFAVTGQPSSADGPTWKAFNGGAYMAFNDKVDLEVGYNPQCDFWEKFITKGYPAFVEMVDFCFMEKIL